MHALFVMIMCCLFMYALSVRYVPYFTILNLPYLIQNVARNVLLYYQKKNTVFYFPRCMYMSVPFLTSKHTGKFVILTNYITHLVMC